MRPGKENVISPRHEDIFMSCWDHVVHISFPDAEFHTHGFMPSGGGDLSAEGGEAMTAGDNISFLALALWNNYSPIGFRCFWHVADFGWHKLPPYWQDLRDIRKDFLFYEADTICLVTFLLWTQTGCPEPNPSCFCLCCRKFSSISISFDCNEFRSDVSIYWSQRW